MIFQRNDLVFLAQDLEFYAPDGYRLRARGTLGKVVEVNTDVFSSMTPGWQATPYRVEFSDGVSHWFSAMELLLWKGKDYAIFQDGSIREYVNLRWIRAQTNKLPVETFKVVEFPGQRWDVELIITFRNGTVYHSFWASREVLRDSLERWRGLKGVSGHFLNKEKQL